MAAAGNTQVKISWTPATGISYNLYRSTASGGEGSVPYLTGVTPPYTDTNLNNGTTYYYTVAAVNSSGTSSQSAQVSAQPGNIPPANRKVALLSVAQMMRYSR
jgi:fibronectin type 3 domain-containing protein